MIAGIQSPYCPVITLFDVTMSFVYYVTMSFVYYVCAKK